MIATQRLNISVLCLAQVLEEFFKCSSRTNEREGAGSQLALISGTWLSVLNKVYRVGVSLSLIELT